MTPVAAGTRKRYEWTAWVIALAAGFAVAVPAGFAVTRVIGSALLLTVVVTLVWTGGSRWTYERVARRGARRIDDETCPRSAVAA